MENGPLTKTLFWLGAFTGVAFILVGIVGGILPQWDDAPASDQIVWVVLGVGGGLALLAGLRLLPRAPWTGTALVSLGAIVGALPIFWAVLPLLLTVALIVLSVIYARKQGRASEATRLA
jgi:hypothetical protein